ncbi:hypothetical protein [Natrialbaceae archaeon AArc-T1-2]|uniref:hypothetical protein n=1 Tax=Natrialbaceae archaeon AArc-T1-2 TaxID=3053904 RepID=UPI00255B3EE1|nr:hypothetical protein [Natrialbaceae archaeon AArc-T1-2]WIV66995.1 hypothetical protein QQ977_15105 [Natrialbaceae archaeon AArc-T1-2]
MDDTHAVGALAALFCVTLFVVYRLEDPVLWVVWAVAMVALAGGALVAMNRGDSS